MHHNLFINNHIKKRDKLIKKIVSIFFIILVFFLGFITHSYSQPWTSLDFAAWRVQQSSLAWGDVNNDGWLDIVIAGNDTGTMNERTRVLFNSKDGINFTLNQELDGFYAGSVSLVDYDNDGDLDLSINGSVPGAGPIDLCRHRIYKNLGDGNFNATFIEPVANWGTWYGNVEWADYNNDGRMDFAITGDADGPGIGSGSTLRVYRNNGNDSFSLQLNGDGNGYLEYSDVTWGDFDGDGDLDIVFVGINGTAGGPNATTFKLQWCENTGGAFNAPVDVDPSMGFKRASIASGDFDNDGDMDFAVTGHSSIDYAFRFRVYRNDGGSFTGSDVAGAFGVIGGSLAAGDMNNDGNLDLVLIGYDGTAKRLYIYTGNANNCNFNAPTQPDPTYGVGDDSFTPPAEFGFSGSSLALADFDNDNNLDIAVTGRDNTLNPSFRIYRNDTGANNTPPNTPASPQSVNNGGNWRFQWTAAIDTQTTDPDLIRYQIAIGTNTSGVYNYLTTNIYHPRGQAQVGNSRTGVEFYDSIIPWIDFKQVYWKVCAIDTSFKTSPFSMGYTVLPEWVSCTTISTNQIDLVWRRFNINNATGYTLYRNTSSTPVGAIKFYVNGGANTNYSDTTLSPGINYYYWLKADTLWGTATPLADYVSTASRPSRAQWIYAHAVSTNQVDLLWHDLSNETCYTLFRNNINDTNTSVKITGLGADITNYLDTNLISGLIYYYWVKAYSPSGYAVFSDYISVVVGQNIVSTILFPLNNTIIDTVEFFNGLVNSPVVIEEEQILLQCLSDNKYFNGSDWQDNELWITCDGITDWKYNILTDKIFTYGVQYTLKARGRDIYGLTESNYPSVLFTYVYSTEFKKSVCNYPNPFYPDGSENITTIEYFLTMDRDVKVHIHAINGELVKKWTGAEYGTSGLHRIKWDGKNENGIIVGSGVYMLIVTADNEKKIEKILVIR